MKINQTGSGRAESASQVSPFEKGGTLEVFSSYKANVKHEFSNTISISKQVNLFSLAVFSQKGRLNQKLQAWRSSFSKAVFNQNVRAWRSSFSKAVLSQNVRAWRSSFSKAVFNQNTKIGKVQNHVDKKTRVIPFLLGLGLWAFSGGAYAVGDMIGCSGSNQAIYETNLNVMRKNPKDTTFYHVGIDALCLGKIKEGMGYIQQASDRGHIVATTIIAKYYKTDGTLDGPAPITSNPEYFEFALEYYEKSIQQIESAGSQYPEGVNEDMPNLERKSQTSAFAFNQLPNLYYTAYVRSIGEILNSAEKLEFKDSLEVLNMMRDSAQNCLERSPLSVWPRNTYRALQVKCQARKDFAEHALNLEERRIAVANNCSAPLSACSAHQDIVNQLVELSNTMWSKVDSVSL